MFNAGTPPLREKVYSQIVTWERISILKGKTFTVCHCGPRYSRLSNNHNVFFIWFFFKILLFHTYFFLFDSKFPPILFIPYIFFLIWFKISTNTFYSIHIFSYLIRNFHPYFLIPYMFFFLFGSKIPHILFIPYIFFFIWFEISTHTFYSIHIFS